MFCLQVRAVNELIGVEFAMRLGNDVDMPRNLAKSVTVG